MIYGVAILAACMFLGTTIGEIIGLLTGVNSDVGGVGFAMLLLLLVTNCKKITNLLPNGWEKGIQFWSAMFLPVIIALSASQNVYSALSGGVLALVAGLAVVAAAFLFLILLNTLAGKVEAKKNSKEAEQ
ncbi:MAG: malonate transporter subunit MadL [Clostridia bacterium]|nr:malonate transporter subunit MadL [Clostridia bacterium]